MEWMTPWYEYEVTSMVWCACFQEYFDDAVNGRQYFRLSALLWFGE
jgi:hypothetical protein